MGQLGSRAEAEDAVQTTFVYALRALRRGVVPENEAAWLTAIAKNVCHWQRRTLARRGPLSADLDLDTIALARPEPDEEGRLFGLEDALASIPEKQREALLLREWRGLAPREIATELGISGPATHALLTRARHSLARALTLPARPAAGIAWLVFELRSYVKALFGGASAKAAVAGVAIVSVGAGGVVAERTLADPAPSVAPLTMVSTPETGAATGGLHSASIRERAARPPFPESVGSRSSPRDRAQRRLLATAGGRAEQSSRSLRLSRTAPPTSRGRGMSNRPRLRGQMLRSTFRSSHPHCRRPSCPRWMPRPSISPRSTFRPSISGQFPRSTCRTSTCHRSTCRRCCPSSAAQAVAPTRLLGEAWRVNEARFADGVRYRIEIPSVEGPEVFRAVLDEAAERGVPIRRISQGSGVMMLTDSEIEEMAVLGAEHGVEVSLFLGPRGAWDAGGQSFATTAAGGTARGQVGVEWCLAEVERGLRLGIRSFLVADLGSAGDARTNEARRRSPEVARSQDVRAVALREPGNRCRPGGARRDDDQCRNRSVGGGPRRDPCCLLDAARRVRRGAGRPGWLHALLRGAGDHPRCGARVREARASQRAEHLPVGAPSPGLAVRLGRERVRRAELVLRLLRERVPDLVEGRGDDRPPDLGIPEP